MDQITRQNEEEEAAAVEQQPLAASPSRHSFVNRQDHSCVEGRSFFRFERSGAQRIAEDPQGPPVRPFADQSRVDIFVAVVYGGYSSFEGRSGGNALLRRLDLCGAARRSLFTYALASFANRLRSINFISRE